VPEPYFEKTPFPAKVKKYSTLVSVSNKSTKKAVEPDEQITIKSPVAILKDLVTKDVGDEYILFCEDASNILSHPKKYRKISVPVSPHKNKLIDYENLDQIFTWFFLQYIDVTKNERGPFYFYEG
jgi:hypothetical protein